MVLHSEKTCFFLFFLSFVKFSIPAVADFSSIQFWVIMHQSFVTTGAGDSEGMAGLKCHALCSGTAGLLIPCLHWLE